jgi:hypothetical protein
LAVNYKDRLTQQAHRREHRTAFNETQDMFYSIQALGASPQQRDALYRMADRVGHLHGMGWCNWIYDRVARQEFSKAEAATLFDALRALFRRHGTEEAIDGEAEEAEEVEIK